MKPRQIGPIAWGMVWALGAWACRSERAEPAPNSGEPAASVVANAPGAAASSAANDPRHSPAPVAQVRWQGHGAVRSARFEGAHAVLLATERGLWRWPFANAEAPSAVAGDALATKQALLAGSAREFVVAAADASALEVWQAEPARAKAQLNVRFDPAKAGWDYSADGTAWAGVQCESLEQAACELQVLDLVAGSVRASAKLGAAKLGGQRWRVRFSPDGTQIALSHPLRPTSVYDASNAKALWQASAGEQLAIDPEGSHAAWVGPHRLLTLAHPSGKQLRLSELGSSAPQQLLAVEFGAGDRGTSLSLSPTRDRVAMLIERPEQQRVAIVSLVGADAVSYPVPRSLGTPCSLQWDSEQVLLVRGASDEQGELRVRLGEGAADRRGSRSAGAIAFGGGLRWLGEGEVSHADGAATIRPRGPLEVLRWQVGHGGALSAPLAGREPLQFVERRGAVLLWQPQQLEVLGDDGARHSLLVQP